MNGEGGKSNYPGLDFHASDYLRGYAERADIVAWCVRFLLRVIDVF